YVLFKMTYHPNWRAIVDGIEQPTAALTPGFIGARLPAGQHHVEFRYEPTGLKSVFLVAGSGGGGVVLMVWWQRTAGGRERDEGQYGYSTGSVRRSPADGVRRRH